MLSQRREIHERQRPCESLARSQTLRGRVPNWEGCPIEAGNPRLEAKCFDSSDGGAKCTERGT